MRCRSRGTAFRTYPAAVAMKIVATPGARCMIELRNHDLSREHSDNKRYPEDAQPNRIRNDRWSES